MWCNFNSVIDFDLKKKNDIKHVYQACMVRQTGMLCCFTHIFFCFSPTEQINMYLIMQYISVSTDFMLLFCEFTSTSFISYAFVNYFSAGAVWWRIHKEHS